MSERPGPELCNFPSSAWPHGAPSAALPLPSPGRVFGAGSDVLVLCGRGQGATLFALRLTPSSHPRSSESKEAEKGAADTTRPCDGGQRMAGSLEALEEFAGVGVAHIRSGVGRIGILTPAGGAFVYARGELQEFDVGNTEGEVQDVGLGAGFEVIVVNGRVYGRGNSKSNAPTRSTLSGRTQPYLTLKLTIRRVRADRWRSRASGAVDAHPDTCAGEARALLADEYAARDIIRF